MISSISLIYSGFCRILTGIGMRAFEQTRLPAHSLVRKAFTLAQRHHEGQVRETSTEDKVAYFSHPVRVAEILQDTIPDCSPELIASALSHDLIEDVRGVDVPYLGRELNEQVASLVDEVTLDESLKGEARRTFQTSTVGGLSLGGRRLRVADRTANLESLAFDPPARWTLTNRLNYIHASRALIANAALPDTALNVRAQEAMRLAERALFVAVRERVRDKGTSGKVWRSASPELKKIVAAAVEDLKLESTLISETGQPLQKTDDLDRLYEDAALAQDELHSVLTRLAEFHGVRAELPGTKDRARAKDVIDGRLRGNTRGINDLARASIVCDSMQDVRSALRSLSHSYRIFCVYDRFSNPPITGYRDMHLVMRSDQSHFCEVQLHLSHLWDTKKDVGDELYRAIRAICSKSGLTADEKKEKKRLFDASRGHYNQAAERHGLGKAAPASCNPVPVRQVLMAFV
jgi:hypothetical protein